MHSHPNLIDFPESKFQNPEPQYQMFVKFSAWTAAPKAVRCVCPNGSDMFTHRLCNTPVAS